MELIDRGGICVKSAPETESLIDSYHHLDNNCQITHKTCTTQVLIMFKIEARRKKEDNSQLSNQYMGIFFCRGQINTYSCPQALKDYILSFGVSYPFQHVEWHMSNSSRNKYNFFLCSPDQHTFR